MDVTGIISQLQERFAEAPGAAQEFMGDPGAFIENLTGQSLDPSELGQVVEGLQGQLPEGLSGILENFNLDSITGGADGIAGQAGDILGGIAKEAGGFLGGFFGR